MADRLETENNPGDKPVDVVGGADSNNNQEPVHRRTPANDAMNERIARALVEAISSVPEGEDTDNPKFARAMILALFGAPGFAQAARDCYEDKQDEACGCGGGCDFCRGRRLAQHLTGNPDFGTIELP
jgi:hypothetical protein